MGRRGRRDDAGPDGVLVVDKGRGPTSHDVVARVRRLAGTRRVGHAGTLDPLATGVLVLGLGRATRLLQHLSGHDKAYRATVRLGVTTSSDDAGGDVLAVRDGGHLGEAAVREALAALQGRSRQVPPAVSAVHVDGRRAHERVRAGEVVELEARDVVVHALEVLDLRREEVGGVAVVDVDVDVTVGAGTYVRALARDAGAVLGVGGSLVALRRTRSGPFDLAEAVDPDAVDDVSAHLLGLEDVARRCFAVVEVDDVVARRLRQGQRVPHDGPLLPAAGQSSPDGAEAGAGAVADAPAGAGAPGAEPPPDEPSPHEPVAVLAAEGLVGLVDLRDGVLRPRTVLGPPAGATGT